MPLGLGIQLGLAQRNDVGVAAGPAITAAGSIDVSTFKIGATQTITAGTATATGGGTVSYEFRHLSDGEVKSTLAAYAHVAADDAESGLAQWRAVESGGSNDGSTSWQTVASGTITYVAPTAGGALSDQSFTQNTGVQTYATSGDFTGDDLTYSLTTSTTGVTINSGTGLVSFDTDVMSIQTGTSIVVQAQNSGGSITSGFSTDIVVADVTAPVYQSSSIAPDRLSVILTYNETLDNAHVPDPSDFTIAQTGWGGSITGVSVSGNQVTLTLDTALLDASTVPAAFVDADWSVATGSGANELDITIASLPANGGAAITDVEYDIDASDTWISLSTATTGTTTVSMAAASTSYAIRLRAVNSVGNAAAGNSESATSGGAAGALELITSAPLEESGAITAGNSFLTAASFTSPHSTPLDLHGFSFFEYPGSVPGQFAMGFGTDSATTRANRSFGGVGVYAFSEEITLNNSGALEVAYFNHNVDNAALAAVTSGALEYASSATATNAGGTPSITLNIPEGGAAVVGVIAQQTGGETIDFGAGVTKVMTETLASGTVCIVGIASGLSADASYSVTVTKSGGSFRANMVGLALQVKP